MSWQTKNNKQSLMELNHKNIVKQLLNIFLLKLTRKITLYFF